MASVFTKIINGDIPSYTIAKNNEFIAFLDIYPLAKGHTLVVPVLEQDYLFDLPEDLLSRMMIFAQKIAKAQKKSLNCQRVGIAVLGFDVPHAHIHLVPLNSEADLNFNNERVKLTPDQMKEIAEQIKSAL